MATTKFNSPTEFDFSCPNKWEDWRDRFLRYRLATKLNKESGEIQVSSLIYSMGIDAENIMRSFGLEDAAKKSFALFWENLTIILFPRKTQSTKEHNSIKENRKLAKVQNNSSEHYMKLQKIVTLKKQKMTRSGTPSSLEFQIENYLNVCN